MPSGPGGWWQLHSIIEYAKQEREFWFSQPPMACPNDGEPMRIAPPNEDGTELFCRFDGFRYPQDWDAATMSGM
jgi:hypothetical protein